MLPVRVLGKCFGYDSDILAGMRWAGGLAVPGVPASAQSARVLNVSLGALGECTTPYRNVVDELRTHNVLVVAGDGWHRGVIGIVASKLVDAFYKPTIVLSVEDGIAHGSCRSIPAFDMLGALDGCADLFQKYGGHRQAAGLTMDAGRIPEFRDRINALGLECLEPTDLMPRLRIDSELRLAGIDSRVVAGLEQMAPFGLANAKPVFDASGVELLGTPRRIKDRHLKVQLRQDGRVFNAIAWRSAEKAAHWEQHRQSLRLAYSLDKQTFRGETTLELTVADIRCPDQAASPGPA